MAEEVLELMSERLMVWRTGGHSKREGMRCSVQRINALTTPRKLSIRGSATMRFNAGGDI